jgi:hypothetical protein
VAELIGVDLFTVLNWERGATKPKFRYLPAIIRFLGYNPSQSTWKHHFMKDESSPR